jgi:hypothetical protein
MEVKAVPVTFVLEKTFCAECSSVSAARAIVPVKAITGAVTGAIAIAVGIASGIATVCTALDCSALPDRVDLVLSADSTDRLAVDCCSPTFVEFCDSALPVCRFAAAPTRVSVADNFATVSACA